MSCGFFERPARLQTAHEREPPGGSSLEPIVCTEKNCFRGNWDRHIERPANFEPEKTGRCNANDFNRVTIQREFPADYRTVTPELPLPKRKTDDCLCQAVAALIVCGRKDAA